jgi:4-hydroxy-3-polyprenylbenzoate decarboxylase
LPTELPSGAHLPDEFRDPRVVLPGILAVGGPSFGTSPNAAARLGQFIPADDPICNFPWIVLVDDPDFVASHIHNFLWVTFTRSDPAADLEGVGAFVDRKHWGCTGPIIVDARLKPHHAPPLLDDPAIERRVDSLAAPGRPLHGIF